MIAFGPAAGFEVRTIRRMGAEQPTLWCLACDRKVHVIYRNEVEAHRG